MLLTFAEASAQGQANNWYFGYHAGITFNTPDGIPVALTNGALSTGEGCATISDAAGNLLFYSDGLEAYNRNHVVMLNGSGLMGHNSATQSCVVIPKPGSNHLFYLFTVPQYSPGNNSLRYSLVDMELDGGLGGIVVSEKNVVLQNNVTERVTAVRHANNTDYWVITHQLNNDLFDAFQVMATGIKSAAVESRIGSVHDDYWAGYLKVSPDGSRLACPGDGGLEVFGFNNTTGEVVGPVVGFTANMVGHPYGTEFSPNSQLLYFRALTNGHVYQADLTLGDSAAIVASQTYLGSLSGGGALQLGPDAKIYLCAPNQTKLGVIPRPDVVGAGCGMIPDAIDLAGNTGGLGLPTFIQSFFNPVAFQFDNLCLGDTTEFSPVQTTGYDSLLWNFGDPASAPFDTSSLTNPTHIFTTPGTYTVSLTTWAGGASGVLSHDLKINPLPQPWLGNDTTLCGANTLLLDAGNGFASYLWNNGSNQQTLQISTSGTYHVQVTDANGCQGNDTLEVLFHPVPGALLIKHD